MNLSIKITSVASWRWFLLLFYPWDFLAFKKKNVLWMGGRCDEGVMKNIAHVSSVGLLYLFGFTSFPLRTFNYTKPNSLSALVLYFLKKKGGVEWFWRTEFSCRRRSVMKCKLLLSKGAVLWLGWVWYLFTSFQFFLNCFVISVTFVANPKREYSFTC